MFAPGNRISFYLYFPNIWLFITLVPTDRKYDCVHAEELANYRKLTDFLAYTKACLLLCMTSYAELPNPDSSAAFRDTITSRAVTSLGHWTTTLNMGHAASVNPGVHCYGNLNSLERLKVSMKEAWPEYYLPNDHIILDNMRMPVNISLLQNNHL